MASPSPVLATTSHLGLPVDATGHSALLITGACEGDIVLESVATIGSSSSGFMISNSCPKAEEVRALSSGDGEADEEKEDRSRGKENDVITESADSITDCWCNYKKSASSRLNRKCNLIDPDLVEEVEMKNILHWNYRNLSQLPPELMDHGKHVQEIYLKRNCITNLPKDLGKLENLVDIYLCGNRLTELPEEISQLQKLQVLDVAQNELTKLPESIGSMKGLKRLILTHNDLRQLPKSMRNLRRLRSLELSGNKLPYLPEEIFKDLHSLEEVYLDGNPIGCLPRPIANLARLRIVSVCNCSLKFLPAQPFKFLLSHRMNRSRSPIHFNEQVLSDFQLLFDNNPDLNYIPFWVLQLVGPHLAAVGSGGSPFQMELKPLPGFTVAVYQPSPDKMCRFYFDKCIAKVVTKTDDSHSPLPSLRESCLRSIFKDRDVVPERELERRYYDTLPANLANILVIGPACFCHWCHDPIFTHIYPLFFKLQVERVPLEVFALESHTNINAYNFFQLEEREKSNGNVLTGFHYSYFAFCSPYCKFVCKTVTATSPMLPFHDYKIAVNNEIDLVQED